MGPTAEQLSQNQNLELDREMRARTDTVTWLAETLNGSMRVTSEYYFDGSELYGEDGGSVGQIFEASIAVAREIVKYNPHLFFELRRRLVEHGEYQDMLEMARGKFNTMVVVSDFPPELMTSSEDVGGYNASRKQTMLRVIKRQTDGSLRMTTQSLDGSNRQALEALYSHMDQSVMDGELLEQRIQRELSDVQQARLIDDLTNVYDTSLAEKFGGQWHGGRLNNDGATTINTYDFATAQADLIEWFADIKVKDPLRAEKLRLHLAAEAWSRFEADKSNNFITYRPAAILQDELALNNFYEQLEQSAQFATILGLTFSGCGDTVGGSLTAMQLEQAGYGNQAGSDKYGSLQFKCSKGHTNTRPQNQLMSHCRHCGISVKC